MARFCFVSFARPGHCDFGGMSYVRTAQQLRRRGHEVRWILSGHRREHLHARVCKLLENFRIPVEDLDVLFFTVNYRTEDLLRSARALEKHLESEEYDCVVVDRACIGAAFAAHAACIPWATVGTDGREWSFNRLRPTVDLAMLPWPRDSSATSALADDLCREDYPKPSSRSSWATSPFLNISFFPRAYYKDGHDDALPAHSHFVGSGPTSDPFPVRNKLLITFGNTFNPTLRRQLVPVVRLMLRRRLIPTLVLAGEETMAKMLREVFEELPHVTVKTWLPYDEAYRDVRVAVGHGGTSHIWYGMRAGTPLLAVPFIGDQVYGGCQLERLNIGRVVLPFVLPGLPSRALRKLGKIGIRFGKREFVNKLHDVLTDEAVLESSLSLSRSMKTGGGVEASASLLERLAGERSCISTCVEPSCCC